METRNTPPANGLSVGPIIVACQWNMSSATGPEYKKKIMMRCRKITNCLSKLAQNLAICSISTTEMKSLDQIS